MTVTNDERAAGPPPAMIPDHPAHHPGHKLIKRVEKIDDGRQLFTCDGCLERGAGTRYRCEHERCNFDLHTCCAVAPDVLTLPLFGDDGRVFLFLQKPPGPPPPRTITGTAAVDDGTNKRRSFRVCVACGAAVRGFVYHCFDDRDDGGLGMDLHPCCARMPDNHALLINDRVLSLQLQREELPRPRHMSNDDNRHTGPETHRRRQTPWGRHRQFTGVAPGSRRAGARDPPAPENTQPNSRLGFVDHHRHQVAPGQAATSDDRTRVRERQPSAARHRSWWKWKPAARSSEHS